MDLTLCINDNDINLFLQKRLLLQSGITKQVVTAADGAAALKYYDDLKRDGYTIYPQLIVLDIHMPNLNGWDFLDKFTADYLSYFKDTKVIINSFTIDEKEMERAKNYPIIIDFVGSELTMEYLQSLKLPEGQGKITA